MSERWKPRHILNGNEADEPTCENDDGTYDQFHLKNAGLLDTLVVTTNSQGKHVDNQLIKNAALKRGDVLEDWILVGEAGEVRAVDLTLRRGKFRHLGVVLRKHLELGVYDTEDRQNISETLGEIEKIQYIAANSEERADSA